LLLTFLFFGFFCEYEKADVQNGRTMAGRGMAERIQNQQGWPKEFKKDVAFLCKIMYNIFRAEK